MGSPLPLLAPIVLLLAACANAPLSQTDSTAAPAHLFWHPAPTDRPVGTALILPGSSGLVVFEDDQHYLGVARQVHALGLDAILVDYKPYWLAAAGAQGEEIGEKIAWVIQQALRWHEDAHPDRRAPVVLLGWSLGSEGVLALLADPQQVADCQVCCSALFYPSNEAGRVVDSEVPLLCMTGEADDVIEVGDVQAFVDASRQSGADIELVTFADAHHGFDIASLEVPRTVRLLPWIGPTATFAFHRQAASAAKARLAGFLAARL